MAVPQWRRASREPPRIGALPKEDGGARCCRQTTVARTGDLKTVARRLGVTTLGGTRLLVRAAPVGRAFTAWRECLPGVVAPYLPAWSGCAPLPFVRYSRCGCAQTPACAAKSLPSALSQSIPVPVIAASSPMRAIQAIKDTAGRRHGSRSGIAWSGDVAPATKPGLIRTAPERSRDRVPGPGPQSLGSVRAGGGRSGKRSEPAFLCDCDLRFSFP